MKFQHFQSKCEEKAIKPPYNVYIPKITIWVTNLFYLRIYVTLNFKYQFVHYYHNFRNMLR